MPQPERTAVLLMGHAFNEINLLRKFLLITSRSETPENKIVDHIQAGQSVILMRMLLGKCFEAWLMFTKRVQPLRGKYLPKVSLPGQKALDDLGRHFADGRMAAIRNQLAFHYGDDDNLVEAHWRKIPEDDRWDYYLSKLNVNSFFFASEMVITGVLTQLALPHAARGTPGHLSEEQSVSRKHATSTMKSPVRCLSSSASSSPQSCLRCCPTSGVRMKRSENRADFRNCPCHSSGMRPITIPA
jgi:hypothetical protein